MEIVHCIRCLPLWLLFIWCITCGYYSRMCGYYSNKEASTFTRVDLRMSCDHCLSPVIIHSTYQSVHVSTHRCMVYAHKVPGSEKNSLAGQRNKSETYIGQHRLETCTGHCMTSTKIGCRIVAVTPQTMALSQGIMV